MVVLHDFAECMASSDARPLWQHAMQRWAGPGMEKGLSVVPAAKAFVLLVVVSGYVDPDWV